MFNVVAFIREEVLPRLSRRPRAILLVGSHAEGNANPASDIDLVGLISEPSDAGTEAFEIGPQVVELRWMTEEHLRDLLEDLDACYMSGRYLFDNVVTRITSAIVVYDPEGIGERLVERAHRFQPSVQTYDELAKTALSFYEDALGMLNDGDPEGAVMAARQAAGAAVDLRLLSRGHRSLKPKWRLRRLRQEETTDDGVLGEYLRTEGLAGTDSAEAERVLASLDRLVCSVLEIDSLADCSRSRFVKSEVDADADARGR